MKKFVKILCVVPVLLVAVLFSAFTENQKVYDEAELLTENQRDALQEECLRIANEKELDIVIVTTDDTDGKSTMEYADDFFDYNNFGYDKPMGTGILYLIDMQHRKAWISTSGGAITYFTDRRISNITSAIQPYLKNGDYYESCDVFLGYVEDYMEKLPNESNLYDYEGNTKGFRLSLEWVLGSLFVSALIAGVSVLVMVYNAGGKVTVNNVTYLNQSGVHINRKDDIFTHKTRTSRTISDSDSGGGGGGGCASSTHTGSSGNSHGGGGCSF